MVHKVPAQNIVIKWLPFCLAVSISPFWGCYFMPVEILIFFVLADNYSIYSNMFQSLIIFKYLLWN